MSLQTPLRPQPGAFERFLLIPARVEQSGQLVKSENDVRTQLMLNAHRDLWSEPVDVTVEVRTEPHAVVVDISEPLLGRSHLGVCSTGTGELLGKHLLEARTKRKNLETARIRVGGAIPVHESSQSASIIHDVRTRLKVKVVRVRKHCLCASILHEFGKNRLDSCFGSHRHKCRCLDVSVRGVDHAGAPKRPSSSFTMGTGLKLRLESETRGSFCGSGRGFHGDLSP